MLYQFIIILDFCSNLTTLTREQYKYAGSKVLMKRKVLLITNEPLINSWVIFVLVCLLSQCLSSNAEGSLD